MNGAIPLVTVVIPTKQRPASLRTSVSAVLAAADLVDGSIEILVVDDASEARTEEVVRNAGTPPNTSLQYVPARAYGGRGQGDARNEGVRRAKAPIVAFTDDDTVCAHDWLVRAISQLGADETLAGLEGAVIPKAPRDFDPVTVRVVQNLRGRGFLTANLVLRRSALLQAGGVRRLSSDRPRRWDHSFREDTDLALRVERHVGRIAFDPHLRVAHPFEHTSIARHLRTALFFEVDAAFSRLHPDALPSIRRAPGARMRIRVACVAAASVPLMGPPATRRAAISAISLAGLAQSIQLERDMWLAGVDRAPHQMAVDALRRMPRAVAWSVAAGVARGFGAVEVRLGLVKVRQDQDLPVVVP